jgi:hypothetical protein
MQRHGVHYAPATRYGFFLWFMVSGIDKTGSLIPDKGHEAGKRQVPAAFGNFFVKGTVMPGTIPVFMDQLFRFGAMYVHFRHLFGAGPKDGQGRDPGFKGQTDFQKIHKQPAPAGSRFNARKVLCPGGLCPYHKSPGPLPDIQHLLGGENLDRFPNRTAAYSQTLRKPVFIGEFVPRRKIADVRSERPGGAFRQLYVLHETKYSGPQSKCQYVSLRAVS